MNHEGILPLKLILNRNSQEDNLSQLELFLSRTVSQGLLMTFDLYKIKSYYKHLTHLALCSSSF